MKFGMTVLAMAGVFLAQPAKAIELEAATINNFADLALACVHREYPNKISHTMTSDADALPPRALHPSFYGCFDWHSSVHGHWLLTRLLHLAPDSPFRDEATAKLAISFAPENVKGEVAYFEAEDRGAYERPYGTAWFLQLTNELRQWNDPIAKEWLSNLAPLEAVIISHTKAWLPKLAYPIRLGTHNQTAFAFGLMLDWAREADDQEMEQLLTARIMQFHEGDKNCPIAYEPSGEDFLSPCLQEADLMRRVMDQKTFSTWLGAFLPAIPTNGDANWIQPGIVKDITDGKLVHLDGVNLSRAFALEGIASALPHDDPRVPSLLATAKVHSDVGLQSVTGAHYAGGHWLASFATYLVTKRGISD